MAGELQVSYQSGQTVYVVIRNQIGQIWRADTHVFETFVDGNWSSYVISLTEQGSSGFYAGTFPTQIVAGAYSIVAKQQKGGGPLETDPTIATGDEQWNGTAIVPLSDTATSGMVSQFLPSRLYRGEMLQNFPFYLVSSTDHVTPFTSGVVSGQICRDPQSGSQFGPLQSGAFNEIGLGVYSLQAFTSGDLLANTVAVMFTATQISGQLGGVSDPRVFTFVLQRTSGVG